MRGGKAWALRPYIKPLGKDRVQDRIHENDGTTDALADLHLRKLDFSLGRSEWREWWRNAKFALDTSDGTEWNRRALVLIQEGRRRIRISDGRGTPGVLAPSDKQRREQETATALIRLGLTGSKWSRWLREEDEKTSMRDVVARANRDGNMGNQNILVKVSLPGNRLCLSLPAKTEVGSLKEIIGQRVRREWLLLTIFLAFLGG